MEREITAMNAIFNKLRLEGKLCDVVIKVDGVEFNAHKIILCGCSEYFEALFTGVWSNCEKGEYNIPGLSPDMMALIIDYAYTRSVPVTGENVQDLLAAADQFSILGLLRVCCQFLEGELCPENCIGIWQFADIYPCPDLKHRAHLYILHHFEEMVRVSQEFLELSPAQLGDIIERDDLNAKREVFEAVFEAVLRWIAHKEQDRKPFINALLSKVRVALVPAVYFVDYVIRCVNHNPLVKDDDVCTAVIRAVSNLAMSGPSNADIPIPLVAQPRLQSAILLAIGGYSGNSTTNRIEAYNAQADRWMNVSKEDESPRAGHEAAYLNGFVYCVGGYDDVQDSCLNSVCKFDPITRTWHQVASMHHSRQEASVAVLGGCIYVMGGFDGTVVLDTAERYEPEADQWTLIPPMHEMRCEADSTALQGKVYICGGGSTHELNTVECYSPDTNQWSLVARMWNRRQGLGVIAYGEQVYAVGGYDGEDYLSNAEVYDPVTNVWNQLPDMNIPRSDFGIEVIDDLLFVMGGCNESNDTCCVERYDAKTNEWSMARNMGIFRSSFGCCVVHGLPNVTEYTTSPDPLPESRGE